MSRTTGKRDKTVEDASKQMIIQGPCNLNRENLEERTGGIVGSYCCWRLGAVGSELENKNWCLESLQLLFMTKSNV